MIFQFMGTAAAEGIPALFCQCDVCKRAAEAGGRNIRGRSGAMINHNILIDFSPDMLANKIRFGLDLAEVSHIFVTHSHIDHLAANELCYYGKMYSNRKNNDSVLTILGNEKVLEIVRQAFKFDRQQLSNTIKLQEIEPFKEITVGEVTLTPLLADHDHSETCVFYLIEQDGKRFLFANDSTMFPQETFKYLEGKRLDAASLDCTAGKFSIGQAHMGFSDNLTVKTRFLAQGTADEHTAFISHHFSHNGQINYEDFPALAGDSGFVSSYDGMVIEL